MADDKFNAAFMADLGVANRERLLAAPDNRDHSLRGRLRPNGTGNSTAQQPNGFGDASVSQWTAFANSNRENVTDGDLADLHGGQLHRLNREAMAGGNPRPMPNPRPAPTFFPRASLPRFNQPQDHTPSTFYDQPGHRFQAPAQVQPAANGNGNRGGRQDALELARSMQFRGSYSNKSRGGAVHANPSPRGPRGGYGGSNFRGARAGYDREDPDFHDGRDGYEDHGTRGGSYSRGALGSNSPGLAYVENSFDVYSTGRAMTRPSATGPRGGSGSRTIRNSSSRGREEVAIRGHASGRPQPSPATSKDRKQFVTNGTWTSAEHNTGPVHDNDDNNWYYQNPLPAANRPQKLASSKEFMSAIMDSKWAPKKP